MNGPAVLLDDTDAQTGRDLQNPAGIWASVLGKLARRQDLAPEEAAVAMSAILEGQATPVQIAGFALALRMKGETTAEMAALVRTLLRYAERLEVDGPLVDTAGTGGDRSGTVNVSTMAALVVAGAGARVAKQGNRAASSLCGSADVLEALGVAIDLGPSGVARCIDAAGIGFCFAPRFHPAFRRAAQARRELGVATTLNFLGPLAHPARVSSQVLGVSDPAMAERLVAVLAELGTKRALVFHGHDGLDELTTTTTSSVWELRDGAIRSFTLDPADYGIKRSSMSALLGGDARCNAALTRRVLEGERGPLRDIVVLNAAVAIVVAGLTGRLEDGIEAAVSSLDDGGAGARLEMLVQASRLAREEEEERGRETSSSTARAARPGGEVACSTEPA